MLILYLTGFGLFLSLAFYVYSGNLAKQRPRGTGGDFGNSGRDMWVATLLDCHYEPAKARFGPAKVIPAGQVLNQAEHKENFSRHMERK
ncbi:MAG: hypothetical protein RTV41_06550 [Candidatus Thorarchaeota archaeon]